MRHATKTHNLKKAYTGSFQVLPVFRFRVDLLDALPVILGVELGLVTDMQLKEPNVLYGVYRIHSNSWPIGSRMYLVGLRHFLRKVLSLFLCLSQ